jgi:hypothetical protein
MISYYEVGVFKDERMSAPINSNLQEIYTEWENNLKFRDEFKKNPEKALSDAGFVLSESDLNKIKSMFLLKKSSGGHDSEDLDKRINK